MMSAAWPRKSIVKNPRTSEGYTYFPYVRNEFQGLHLVYTITHTYRRIYSQSFLNAVLST